MGFRPEVFVEGKWAQNGLVFATEQEAFTNACDLMDRWVNVMDARAVEVEGLPANYRYVDHRLERIEP